MQSLIRWLPSLKPEQVNVVLTGKDSPNIGLVNVISYDLLVKKIREIQKVGYKVVIVVSVNTFMFLSLGTMDNFHYRLTSDQSSIKFQIQTKSQSRKLTQC